MKKLFSIFAIASLLACSSIVPNVQGAAFLGNPDPLARSCSTNYSRTLSNFCQRTAAGYTETTLTSDNTCRALDLNALFGIPTSATYVTITITNDLRSGNAIQNHSAALGLYSDAGCTARAYPLTLAWTIREFAAVAANTTLWKESADYTPIALAANATLYYVAQDALNCTNCVMSAGAIGYYD